MPDKNRMQMVVHASTYAKTHKPMSDTDAEGWSPQDHSPTITYWPRDRSDAGTDVAVVQPVVAPPLTATNDPSRSPQSSEVTAQVEAVHAATMSVRRLTPTECERLQGFHDGWTQIAWKGKQASECPDGPRYKALGNSMAVNCMRWIGARIQAVEEA
jgi:site-specific DNA-cytosine methylase